VSYILGWREYILLELTLFLHQEKLNLKKKIGILFSNILSQKEWINKQNKKLAREKRGVPESKRY
jgi:hypothetical protein